MNPLLMTSQDPTDSRNVSSSCRNCAIFSCFDGIMEIGLLLQPSKHTAWKRQRPPPSPSRSDSPTALSSSHLSPHVVFNPPTHSEIKANLNIDLKRKEKFCYFAMNLQVLKDSRPPIRHMYLMQPNGRPVHGVHPPGLRKLLTAQSGGRK